MAKPRLAIETEAIFEDTWMYCGTAYFDIDKTKRILDYINYINNLVDNRIRRFYICNDFGHEIKQFNENEVIIQ